MRKFFAIIAALFVLGTTSESQIVNVVNHQIVDTIYVISSGGGKVVLKFAGTQSVLLDIQDPDSSGSGIYRTPYLENSQLKWGRTVRIGTDSAGIPWFVTLDTLGTVAIGSGLSFINGTLATTGGGWTGNADSIKSAYVNQTDRDLGSGITTLMVYDGGLDYYQHKRVYPLDSTRYGKGAGSSFLILRNDTLRIANSFFNVGGFGGTVDDDVDDATIINSTVAAALAAGGGTVQLSSGTWKIASTVPVPSGITLEGMGLGATKIDVAMSDTAFLLQGQYATIRNLQIQPASGYEENYIGIASTLADRCYVENINIMSPSIGILLYDECHFNIFNSIYIYDVGSVGIKLARNGIYTPNSNLFILREVIGEGPSNKEGTGLDITGVDNTFIGGELAYFDVAARFDANYTTSNYIKGVYEENCDTSWVANGGHNYVDGYWGDDLIVVAYNAELTGPYVGLSSYSNTPIIPVNFDSCRVIYTFQEGQGTTLYDRSGNGYDGTLQNGGTWTDGIYGKALQLTSASSHQISIPTAAIDPTRQYTIVMAWKPVTMSSNNALFRIEDGSDYHRISADNGGNYYKSYMNPSATSGTVTSTIQRNSYWNWMAVCYDPVVGRFYSFDATTGFDSVGSVTNDISTVSAIYVGKSVASTVATYGYLGIWQRKLSIPEVRSIVNSKSPVVAPSVPVLAKGTATFSTTNARVAVYIPGATSSDLYWLQEKSPDGTTAPILADQSFAYAKTDSLIVIRGTGGTSGLSVFWQRIK